MDYVRIFDQNGEQLSDDIKPEQHVTAAMAARIAMPFQRGTGYGKSTTAWKVFFAGRLRRIYSICYSNSATLYILVKGKKFFVR